MAVDFGRILANLNNAGIQKKDPRIYQVLSDLLKSAQENVALIELSNKTINDQLGNSLTFSTEADLVNYKPRTLAGNLGLVMTSDTDKLFVTRSNGTLVEVGGGSTPINLATFLTVANETATLPNSRRLLAGSGINFDDSVANVRTISSVNGIVSITTILTNNQIKALPTTPITLTAPSTSGFRNKLIAGTILRKFVTVGYTNVDPTYGSLQLQTPNGDWLSSPIINDSSGAPTSDLTNFFAIGYWLTDLLIPTTFADPVAGWQQFIMTTDISSVDNVAIEIAMDNNGSGNLTAGDPSNIMPIILYYLVEAI